MEYMCIKRIVTILIATILLSFPAIKIKQSILSIQSSQTSIANYALLNIKLRKKADAAYNLAVSEALQAKQAEEQANAQVAIATPSTANNVQAGNNCEQYRQLISQYSWNVTVAMAVMSAESGCRAGVKGGPNTNGTYDHGLFQLNQIPVYDPAENIRIAYQQKYLTQGWGAWSVCNSGKVSCWL